MSTPSWSSPEGQPADAPVHVYPLGDLREHVIDLMCPCMPRLVDPAVVRHNSYDGREVGEVVLRALDGMGKALADHGHTWTPALRDDYEHAVDLIRAHHKTPPEGKGGL